MDSSKGILQGVLGNAIYAGAAAVGAALLGALKAWGQRLSDFELGSAYTLVGVMMVLALGAVFLRSRKLRPNERGPGVLTYHSREDTYRVIPEVIGRVDREQP